MSFIARALKYSCPILYLYRLYTKSLSIPCTNWIFSVKNDYMVQRS